VEGRLDELEADNERLLSECQRLDQEREEQEWQARSQKQLLEKEIDALKQEAKDNESKHKRELLSAEERLALEKTQLEQRV
jgi:hypothetical protein